MINNRFEIKHKLGEGGMGQVYLATDTQTGAEVALKIASLVSRTAKERFTREVEILSGINHNNIVRLISSGASDDALWYTMDYIPGDRFVEWFASQNVLDYNHMTEMCSGIASALSTIHNRGIVHRDLKPENILMQDSASDAGRQGDVAPVLVDFGVAHLRKGEQTTRLTREGSMVGTVLYMSPEQVMGSQIDGRSDLYSLGTIMYEILTGEHPLSAPDLPRLIFRILQERPLRPTVLNPDIPKDLETIVMKLLEKNPDLRFSSAEELKVSLQRFANGETLTKSTHQSPMRRISKKEVPLVGRSQELDKLSLLLHQARTGSGQVVSIVGGHGAGKSRLIEEFRLIALGELSKFILCYPQPEDSSRPAISSMLDSIADYEIACDTELLARHPHMIRNLSPKLADSLGLEKDPPNIQDKHETPKVISELLATSFPEILSIFAFENGIDELTASIAFELAKKSVYKEIIVCCATQQTSPQDSPRTGKWVELPNYTEVILKPFTAHQINELACAILDRNLTEPEMQKIEENTKGNPHLAVQFLSSMRVESKTVSLTSIPEDIDSIYRERVGNLDSSSRGLLELLSLLKRPVPSALLQPISRLSGTYFQDAFDDLERLDLIREIPSGRDIVVQIASDKLRDIASDTIEEASNKPLHKMIAGTLEIFYSDTKDPDVLSAIGKHYLEAGEYDKANRYINKALKKLDKNSELSSVMNIIKIIEPHFVNFNDIQKSEILSWFIIAYGTKGEINKFEEYKKDLLRIVDKQIISKPKLSYTYLIISNAYSAIGNNPLSVEYLALSEKYLKYADHITNIQFQITQCMVLVQQAKFDELYDNTKKLELLLDHPDASELHWMALYQYKAIFLSEKNRHEEAIEQFRNALDVSRKINHKVGELRSLSNIGNAWQRAGNEKEALRMRKQTLELASQLNVKPLVLRTLMAIISRNMFLGQLKSLRKYLAELKIILDDMPPSHHHVGWLGNYMQLRILEGHSREIEGLISSYKEMILRVNQPLLLRTILEYEAFNHFYSGNLKKAKSLFELMNDAYNHSKDEFVTPYHFLIKIVLIELYLHFSDNTSEAEILLQEATELQKIFDKPSAEIQIKFANAEILYMKSIRKSTLGHSISFNHNFWRIAYNNILEVLSFTKDNLKLAMLPVYSTILFAKLIIQRMKYDKKLRPIEKRQIFDQAVKRLEWMLHRYEECNFTFKRDEMIELNNELILLMDKS